MFLTFKMNTLLIAITFCGFYLLINTSKKAVLRNGMLENSIQNNPKTAKIIGVFCLMLVMVTSVFSKGISSGILFVTFAILLVGSLVVLLNPIKIINFKWIIVILLVSLIVEVWV